MAAPPGVMSASPVMEGTTRWTIAASGRDEVKPGIKVATDDGHEFDLDDYPVFEPEEADAEEAARAESLMGRYGKPNFGLGAGPQSKRPRF